MLSAWLRLLRVPDPGNENERGKLELGLQLIPALAPGLKLLPRAGLLPLIAGGENRTGSR